jgi:glucokinase
LDKTSPLAVGCDLGGTCLKTVLLDRGKLRHESVVPVVGDSATTVVDAIVNAVREALVCSPRGALATLGIAVPGFLDERRRRIELLSNLPVLNGLPLASRVARRLSKRIVGSPVLDADSNAGAFAEARLGAGKGSRRVLYLSLGTGVGAAMVCDGRIQRVSHHTVGQIAHLPLDPDGRKCPCGRRGCAEVALNARGILWRARQRGLKGPSVRSPEALFEAALNGKSEAKAVWREVGDLLGDLAGTLGGLFSPDHIVVGGGIAGASELVLETAGTMLERRLPARLRGQVALDASRWGLIAGAVGAALLSSDTGGPPERSS